MGSVELINRHWVLAGAKGLAKVWRRRLFHHISPSMGIEWDINGDIDIYIYIDI